MNRSEKSSVIIILGPPGSGKGSQAELLAEKLSFFHLETSRIIEANLENIKKSDFVKIGGKKYFLVKERKTNESGGLMSPPLINFWVKNKVKELKKERKGIIFSGSPRTLYEGKELTPFLKKIYGAKNIKIILLELKEKESIWRNSHRRSCKLLRHPILFTKETQKLTKCPFDGSKLFFRKDDKPEVIKIRLKEYKERTFPLIGLFKKEGLKVKIINGQQSVVNVFNNILKALKT